MKRLLPLTAVLALIASGTVAANADNILANPTLDDIAISSQNGATPTSWTVEATKSIDGTFLDGASSETFCNVVDSGGYGLFFKPFQGNAAASNLLSVFFYQDIPTSPGTKFTLSGYAAGEANFCAFFTTNAPAPKALFVIEFLNNSSAIIASNAFDLVAAGLPNGGPGSMSSFLYTTPQVTAPANTATVRAGTWMLNAYGTGGAQSFFVDGFDLEAVAPAGSPVITNQPSATTVAPGATATFTVGVSNTAGVSYQWQHANTNLSNGGNISGANSQTLTITGSSTNDVGRYRVVVSNGSGFAYSLSVPLALQTIHFYPVVELRGRIGDTYRVDYTESLSPTNWIPFSTNTLITSPQLIVDPGSPGSNSRFYRSVFLH